MSSPRVRADYDSLAAIARIFGHEAANTRQTLRHVRRQMEVLQNGDWIGRGATAFYQEMNDAILPSLQRLAAALEVAGRAAEKISQIMRAAEEEASAILRPGSEGGVAAMPGGGATSSGSADDEDIFADVYAALDRERAGGAEDGSADDEDIFADVYAALDQEHAGSAEDEEDIFAGVNISDIGSGVSDTGVAGAEPTAGSTGPEAPAGGGGGDRRRGQGGVGGVGGASLDGGEVGPEKNPLAR